VILKYFALYRLKIVDNDDLPPVGYSTSSTSKKSKRPTLRTFSPTNELDEDPDERPQIAAIVDDRPEEVQALERFQSRGLDGQRWKTVGAEALNEASGSVNKNNAQDDSDLELSPAKRRRDEDSDLDLSPVRRRNNQDSDLDLSPVRSRRRQNSDSDLSPPRNRPERESCRRSNSKNNYEKSRYSYFNTKNLLSKAIILVICDFF